MKIAHCYKDVFYKPKWQIRLSFRFGKNIFSVFTVEEFELNSKYLFLTEIVNLNHRKFYNF